MPVSDCGFMRLRGEPSHAAESTFARINVLAVVPKAHIEMLAAVFRSILALTDPDAVRRHALSRSGKPSRRMSIVSFM